MRRADWVLGRIRNAELDLEQILAAPGEFPTASRQTLESVADDILVAERLIRKIVEPLR